MRVLHKLLVVGVVCSGCDGRGSTGQTTTSTPPQPGPNSAVPTRPAVQDAAAKYAAYKAHVQPLIDELNAVAAMVDKPATMTFSALDAQYNAIHDDEARLIPTMPDVGSGSASAVALTDAAVDVRKADVTWAELNRLRGQVAAGNTTMPDGSPAGPYIDMGQQFLTKHLAKAAVDIAAMNAAFKDGR